MDEFGHLAEYLDALARYDAPTLQLASMEITRAGITLARSYAEPDEDAGMIRDAAAATLIVGALVGAIHARVPRVPPT